MIKLRPYQEEAVAAVYRYLREHEDNPCVVLPTAAGKSMVLAQMAKDAVSQWQGRVLILAHVKELLEQNADKIQRLAPDLPIGIYSAGLKSRDTLSPVIVAGIQSAYRRADELGWFDLVIVDEVHCIPPDGEGMYRTLLAALKKTNPLLRIIGLTATPFRMTSGSICAPENILNAVCYEAGVRELMVQGYLCRLISKAGKEKADTSNLHVRAGEYVASEVETLMDTDALVDSACREILDYTSDRKACLVFTSGIRHGTHVAETLRRLGANVETVFGETLDFERDRVLLDFKAGRLKYLVNVNVLTTGFDAPNIDCVVMLRPTLSPGLWYQCCGRGFRIHPDKVNCLVLDYGGNALRHGPVDAIRIEDGKTAGPAPAKECPQCHSIVGTGYSVCPDCGHEFFKREEERKPKHAARAGGEGILSDEVTVETHPVEKTVYDVHCKRGAPPDAPRSMRVEYRIGWQHYVSEWICLEHTGFARHKAELWWKRRSNLPVPDDVEEAVRLAEAGALCPTLAVTVRSVAGEKYDRIVDYKLGEKPAYREPGWDDDVETVIEPEPAFSPVDDDFVPF